MHSTHLNGEFYEPIQSLPFLKMFSMDTWIELDFLENMASYLHRSGMKCFGKLGREEPDEVQQGQVQGPAPGEEQPHAPVQAQGSPAGEQLCREGPGCAGG